MRPLAVVMDGANLPGRKRPTRRPADSIKYRLRNRWHPRLTGQVGWSVVPSVLLVSKAGGLLQQVHSRAEAHRAQCDGAKDASGSIPIVHAHR